LFTFPGVSGGPLTWGGLVSKSLAAGGLARLQIVATIAAVALVLADTTATANVALTR
jgi:hypothetical protein